MAETLPIATEMALTATETVPTTTEALLMAQMTRPTAGETPPEAEETVPTAQMTGPTVAVIPPTVSETVPTAAEPEERGLSESNHSVLYGQLKEHSAKWRDIGIHLGFRSSELNDIQARPLLLNNAPKSWLEAMLSEWLQWAPGDHRGSNSYATLEQLMDVLKEVGLSITLDLTKCNSQ